jgi:hypothetical protein
VDLLDIATKLANREDEMGAIFLKEKGPHDADIIIEHNQILRIIKPIRRVRRTLLRNYP